MTPFERIQRNKGLEAFALARANPKVTPAAFPRNSAGLTVLALAVVPLMYKGIMVPSALNILCYGLLTLGFGLALGALAEGLKAQAIYDAANVARAPRHAFKIIGAALMGLSAGGLTLFQHGDALQSFGVALVTCLACVVAFGRDPGMHKGFETLQQRQSYKLDALTAHVGLHMERIREAAAIHGDRDVMPRVRAFDDAVEALLVAAMYDPSRLSSMRKYFGVYLASAAEAAERFAAVYSGTGDPAARQRHLDVLDKLISAFSGKAMRYAEGGQLKLDVEHDVLAAALDSELQLNA